MIQFNMPGEFGFPLSYVILKFTMSGFSLMIVNLPFWIEVEKVGGGGELAHHALN